MLIVRSRMLIILYHRGFRLHKLFNKDKDLVTIRWRRG